MRREDKERLASLHSELTQAAMRAVAEDPQVAAVAQKYFDAGYAIVALKVLPPKVELVEILTKPVNLLLAEQQAKTQAQVAQAQPPDPPEFRPTPEDEKFLKTMRVSTEEPS